MEHGGRRRRRRMLAGLLLCGLVSRPARGVQATIDDYQISFDTTLTSGVDLRTSGIDERFVGAVNGGHAPLPNGDNGTLNFRPGAPVAATQRITTELEVKRDDNGLFLPRHGLFTILSPTVNARSS